MSKDMKPATTIPSSAGMFDSLSTFQQEAMTNLVDMGQSIFNGVVELQTELTTFVAGRVVNDLELQKRLLDCRSVDDAMAVQGDFVEKAMSEYSDEAQKLVSIGSNMVKEDVDVSFQSLSS